MCIGESLVVTFEQAVYGSFAFRGDGYAPLANSPGCRPDWLAAFHAACRLIGEKPAGAGDLSGMMFSMRTDPRGPGMIVGVSSPGSDDRGRPDALAFHALFVEGREFRKVGYDPFTLRNALRGDFGPETTLARASIAPERPDRIEEGDRALAVASALKRGRKVALASDAPIIDLARQVWRLLPGRVRKRCAVATWTFAESARFDFVGARTLTGWDLGGAYVDPFAARPRVKRPVRIGIIALGVAALVTYGIARWWNSREAVEVEPDSTLSYGYRPKRNIDPTPGPDRSAYAAEVTDSEERGEILKRLHRFCRDFRVPATSHIVDGNELAGDKTIPGLIVTIKRWRYTGALLNSDEIATLSRDPSPGRSRALAWDRQIRHFVEDRPTLTGSEPLRWGIDTLSWSFHVEPDPKLTILEAIDALADALTLDEPIQPNPLEAKYPVLGDYAKFLAKLPVR